MSILFMLLPFSIMIIIFGLFIWQAVWVAIDSRKREEEYWWLWTIAAIIAFPIGVIIYILVVNNDKNICNYCGKNTPKGMNACPYCGQKCGYICDNCGQKMQKGWSYCPNCSTKVSEEVVSNNKGIKKNNKPLIIITSIIVAIFLLIVGMFFATFGMFGYVGNKSAEYVTDNSGWPESDGYTGQEYNKSYTDKVIYNVTGNAHSFWYKGEAKRGEIIINIIDESGNEINSKVLKDNEFIDVFILENAKKVEVEFKNFKGNFYYRFN